MRSKRVPENPLARKAESNRPSECRVIRDVPAHVRIVARRCDLPIMTALLICEIAGIGGITRSQVPHCLRRVCEVPAVGGAVHRQAQAAHHPWRAPMNNVTPISSAVVLQFDNDLAAIANRIRERFRRTTSDIIDTGRDLQIVKNRLGHGPFLAWIDAEFGMTARSAQRYMLVAEFAAGKNDIVSHLSPTVAYQLAAPSTPQAIEAGKSVVPRAIEERIKQERLNERGRLAAVRRSRRQKAKSPAARKRHEAAVRKHQAEVEARSQARAAAAAEAVAILRKLPPQDFDRLRDLLKDYDTASATLEQFRKSAS